MQARNSYFSIPGDLRPSFLTTSPRTIQVGELPGVIAVMKK